MNSIQLFTIFFSPQHLPPPLPAPPPPPEGFSLHSGPFSLLLELATEDYP